MVFQKKDLDVTMVDVCIKSCLKNLESLKAGTFKNTYLHELGSDLIKNPGKYYYKGIHVTTQSSCQKHFENIRNNFIENIIDNVVARFPKDQRSLLTAFGILGKRPISFLSEEELTSWGDK